MRSLWALLLAFALSLFAVGCTGGSGSRSGSSSSRGGRSATDRRATGSTVAATPVQELATGPYGLTFSHPVAWREWRYSMASMFSTLIVYLSDADLHDPCTTTRSPQGLTSICETPIPRLGPGQVLVTWSAVGFPHLAAEVPHPNAKLGGQPARVTTTRAPQCASLGAEASITADVARPGGGRYEMVACLRGPSLARNRTLVLEMLDSLHITS